MKHKILIIDDEEQMRHILRDMLEGLGHTVILACNGQEGIQKFDSSITLVITDFHMPIMSGGEVIKYLWENSPLTPVILMSGRSGDQDVEEVGRFTNASFRKPEDIAFDKLEALIALVS